MMLPLEPVGQSPRMHSEYAAPEETMMTKVFEASDLVSNADIAIRTTAVLRLLEDGKAPPSDAKRVLKAGSKLLKEAIAGSSLFTGSAQSSAFAGDLLPLCWATDGYMLQRSARPGQPDYGEIEKFLGSVSQVLECVVNWLDNGDMAAARVDQLSSAADFFDDVAHVLTQEADNLLLKPPHKISSTYSE